MSVIYSYKVSWPGVRAECETVKYWLTCDNRLIIELQTELTQCLLWCHACTDCPLRGLIIINLIDNLANLVVNQANLFSSLYRNLRWIKISLLQE